METDPLLQINTTENNKCLFYDSDELLYLKKINRLLKCTFICCSIGFIIIIIIMILALTRINSTLNKFDKVNLTTIEETANNFNQILSNNGTEKIILFLDSIDPTTITLYMIKLKNIIDEACTYFFSC